MYVILNMLNTRPENKSSVRDKGFTTDIIQLLV